MDYTGKYKYEDIATSLFGRKFGIVTTVLALMTILSANISYTVYVTYFSLIIEIVINKHAKCNWYFY